MKFSFKNSEKLDLAISLVKDDLGLTVAEEGDVCVEINEVDEYVLTVELDGAIAKITYGGGKVVFLRGLAMLCGWVRGLITKKSLTETPIFTLNGAMVDMSRNAVMKPDTVKLMMRKMALMGLNAFMLYTEDTYEIEGRPYFGYMRGRYTKEELRELDAYAYELGIELIPCIQFLGHLATHLKWAAASPYKDTQNVMLVGADATYEMIDDMLKTVVECFRTKRIHVGMDETFDLGRGAYMAIHGFTSQKELYLTHLRKITEMAHGYGLEPMMWSDMMVHLAGEELTKRRVYDTRTQFSDEFKSLIPEGMQQVFWDYYNADESFYAINIDNHQKHLCKNTMFAGGIWTWSGYTPLFKRSLKHTLPAFNACKKAGVTEVIATIWHNGAECNLILSLAGLAWYADYGYKGEYNEESVKECFAFATGESYDSFTALEEAEEPTGEPLSFSRTLLYNDPLIPLLDRHLVGIDLKGHYVKTTEKLSGISVGESYAPAFDVVTKLSSLFENKADFGLRLKAAYDKGDREELTALADECELIRNKVRALKLSHRKAWMFYNKPFGWEALDIRYGGIEARLETARDRICNYLAGEETSLPELEEERLRLDCREGDQDLVNNRFLWNSYQTIATVSIL